MHILGVTCLLAPRWRIRPGNLGGRGEEYNGDGGVSGGEVAEILLI